MESIRFADHSCEVLCSSSATRESCLVEMASAWKFVLEGMEYDSVDVTVSCGSIIVTLAGPRGQVMNGISSLSDGCFLLSKFGWICTPGNHSS